MAADSRLTSLSYALLGLLIMQPQSGYSLRRVFDQTPMRIHSSSPGSIYPALHRLRDRGLIRRDQTEDSARPVFCATPEGRNALIEWLRGPVTRHDVERRHDVLMLRFVYTGALLSRADLLDYLRELARKTRRYADDLAAYLERERDNLGEIGALALEHGIAEVRARANWAEEAQAKITRRVSHRGAGRS